MFDPQQQFFPTPAPVIEQMLAPYIEERTYKDMTFTSFGRKVVLDPSAGKGDILAYIEQLYKYERRCPTSLLAIEIDPELRHILHGKRYKVVDTDFLEYGGEHRPDLIAMNPPFNTGVEHLLHAWDILWGGDIACLLNAESIRNPCTAKRKLLSQVIGDHGSVEFIGQAFKDAERPTDVEVALVRLHKEPPPFTLEFSQSDFDHEAQVNAEAFAANPLASHDIIQSLVAQYDAAVRVVMARHQLWQELQFYTEPVARPYKKVAIGSSNPDEDLQNLKDGFWGYIFDKTRLGEVTTSDFQKRFESFRQETQNLSFSVRNIREVLRMFFENREQIMAQCLLEVFDRGTAFHEKNRVHWEGWKTNKAYKLNKRIIVPYGMEFDSRWGSWRYPYGKADFYRDLDKVMCYLEGRDISRVRTIADALQTRVNEINRGADYTEPLYTTYFKVRFYKKGTLHLDFLDPFLLNELNKRAAQGKNWLGGGY